MTELEMLCNCSDLWGWIATLPEETVANVTPLDGFSPAHYMHNRLRKGELKQQWPGWAKNGGHVHHCLFACPACEYTYQKAHGTTSITAVGPRSLPCANHDSTRAGAKDQCPLKELWPEGCENAGPYREWLACSSVEDFRRHAFAIAAYCNKRIHQIGEETNQLCASEKPSPDSGDTTSSSATSTPPP